MRGEVVAALGGRAGHFLLESGHHGEVWLDLDGLFLRPRGVVAFAETLAALLAPSRPDVVCGPLVGGALVALTVAAALDVDYVHAERVDRRADGAGVAYRVPDAVRGRLRGRRVALVDDVTNAASAVRATAADLDACGAAVVVLGALAVLGGATQDFAAGRGIPVQTLAAVPNRLWAPDACPLCAAGRPLERLVP